MRNSISASSSAGSSAPSWRQPTRSPRSARHTSMSLGVNTPSSALAHCTVASPRKATTIRMHLALKAITTMATATSTSTSTRMRTSTSTDTHRPFLRWRWCDFRHQLDSTLQCTPRYLPSSHPGLAEGASHSEALLRAMISVLNFCSCLRTLIV
eukprot:m.94353 g.94353  ORF g.94353 m.94353 type:complete len:154 (-) comp51239_c0_seq1:108-569(-)